MTDQNKRPYRVSKAYIFGLTDNPFKEAATPPKPSEPSALARLLTTPGSLQEWIASDGRKNSVAKAQKRNRNTAGSSKAPNEKRAGQDGNDKEKKSADWTESDDKKLMEWKNENPNAPWAGFAKEIGKPDDACRIRFKQIKPADWKPNKAKENDGNNDKATNKQGKKGNKQGEKKEEETSGDDPANMWGGGSWDIFGDDGDKQKFDSGNTNNDQGAIDTSWDKWDNGDNTKGNDAWGNNGDNNGGGWNVDSGGNKDQTTANAWDTPAGNNDGNDKNLSAWDTPAHAEPTATKANSAKGSKRQASKSRSHRRRHSHGKRSSVVGSHGVELKPDETFSADDLRLIARILQSDASMVWDRVSWRFGDKTGRYNIGPEVFEKKVTGRVESKDSRKCSRKEK